MKTRTRITLVLLLALILAACGGDKKKKEDQQGAATPSEATLTVEQNQVEYRAGGSETWVQVTGPIMVGSADMIRTDATGRAVLNFYTGTEVEILPGVELTITQFEETADGGHNVTLRQLGGETQHQVARIADREDRYVIETPSATLTVRGTEFGVEVAPDGATTIEVRAGVVQAQAGQQIVEVNAGEALDILADQTMPSTPYPIPVIRPPATTPIPTETPPLTPTEATQ